jgi:sulfonate transport system substrate-binding protein
MRIPKLAKLGVFAGVCALGLFGAATANAADPVKIRLSWIVPVSNWASLIEQKKDLSQHLGKSYTL